MLYKLYISILVILQLHYSLGQLSLSREISGCAGKSVSLDCTSPSADYTNTIFLEEVIYGLRNDPSKDCGYTSGDCFQEKTDKICSVVNQKCTLPVYTTVLLPCFGNEKKADYLRAQFTCVPNSFANNMNTYDICSGGDLNSNYGIIQSPNYPKYTTSDTPCIRKLVAPAGKSFNVWVTELNLKKSDANGCSDYVKISDSTGISDVCGSQAKSFVRQFCSNEIYISYKATTPQTPLIATYKGFKLYYETFTIGANSGCPTGPAINPTEGSTTPTTTTAAPALTDTQATPIEEFKLCKGESRNFVAPTPYHVFYLEDFFYGVSSSDPQGTCPAYNPSHCINPIASQCSMKSKCTINFVNNIALSNCGSQNAQYLFGRFRYIPTQSTSTASVCLDTNVNADSKPRGVITSRGYPVFQQNENCRMTLSVSDKNKAFRIYITDIYMDPSNLLNQECQQSYVKVSDQASSSTYCNVISSNRIYSFTSCSNTATIDYKSSSATFSFYVGFRAYYEVINKQFECPDVQTTTTTKPSVTTTPSNLPLFSPILTTDNQKCTTPFVYKQQSYDNCINTDFTDYWCSVSGNADVDGKKSNCKLGLTQNIQYNLCVRQTRRLSCPKNYVIFVFSSDYAITEDNTCDGKITCTASDNNYVKNTCAGKNECSLAPAALSLFNCQNKVASILQLDYACIPDNVAGVKSYDVCGSDSQFDSKGFITSPNYPSSVSSRDCQNKIFSFGSRIQFISVYAVSVEVGTSAIIGTKCQNSYLAINDGDKICGSVKTSLLYEGCSNFFKMSLSVGSETKGFKLYYEVVDDSTLCSQSTTTTTPTTPTSPQITTPPPYVAQGIASSTIIEHFCTNGNAAKTITCPNNYIIAFRNKFYGISNLGSCFYLPFDCTAFVDGPEDNCAGSQSCTVRYSPIQLLNCQNKLSNYLRIEYDCIPVSLATQPMCDRTFTAKNGLISSPNYPQYKTGIDCSTQITVAADKSIKLYIVNMALNSDCSRDTLELIDPYIANSIKVCGEEKTNLITETCTNQLNIRLRTGDVTSSSFKGVQLYYEEIPKILLNFQCIAPTTTRTTTPFSGTTTTTTTTTTTRPSYNGFASQTYSYVSCANITIECPSDYVIVFKESAYGVSSSNQCAYSPNDCFAKYAFPITLCSGNQKCSIVVKPSISLVSSCGNKYANYIYLQYQCLPKITAGNPPREQFELCGEGAPSSIAANSAILFKSPSYPSYPTDTKSCSKNITVPAGSTILAYALDLNFQGSQAINCGTTSNYLDVSDGAEKASYCSSLNYATFIFQTRSNWINLNYLLKNTVTTSRNRGFLLYLETFTSTVTNQPSTEKPTAIPTRTTVNHNGLAGPYRHDEVCVYTQKELYCTNKYVLVIHKEFLISTGTGCSHSGNECSQPAQVVTSACAGKPECLLYLAPTPIPQCGTRIADLIDIEYQCIPTEVDGGSRVYSCDSPNIDKVKNGFIISPGYSTYTPNVKNCDITITPNANEGIKLFLVDLATSQPTESGCIDGLKIDGQENLCGSDTARLLLETSNSRPVTINYNSLNTPQDGLRGFKIYFETFSLSSVTTTPTQTKAPRTTIKAKNGHNHTLVGVSLGLGVPLCIVIAGLVYYFRRMSLPNAPQIRFSSKNNESKINEDIRSFANPNASL